MINADVEHNKIPTALHSAGPAILMSAGRSSTIRAKAGSLKSVLVSGCLPGGVVSASFFKVVNYVYERVIYVCIYIYIYIYMHYI